MVRTWYLMRRWGAGGTAGTRAGVAARRVSRFPRLGARRRGSARGDVDLVAGHDDVRVLPRNDVVLPLEPLAAERPVEPVELPAVVAAVVVPLRPVGVVPPPIAGVPVAPVAIVVPPVVPLLAPLPPSSLAAPDSTTCRAGRSRLRPAGRRRRPRFLHFAS